MELQTIVDLFFPPQCGGCAASGSGLCVACLPPGEPLQRDLRTLRVTALGPYDGGLRRAVLALKRGRRDVARAFAKRLARVIPPGAVLVPIPTTAARRRERGFDGCTLIARYVCAEHTATLCAGLVQIAGDSQRGRHREERLRARARFVWRGETVRDVPVMLLDDVVTTGATLEDAAGVLRAQGAQVAHAFTVATA